MDGRVPDEHEIFTESKTTLEFSYSAVENHPDLVLIFISGSIDSFTTSIFQNYVEKFIRGSFTGIILDLAAVDAVSAAGVGTCIRLLRSAGVHKKEVILIHMSHRILEIFNILGITELFSIYASMDEYMSKLKGIGTITRNCIPE